MNFLCTLELVKKFVWWVSGGGWVVCKPILVFYFGPNKAFGHGLRLGLSRKISLTLYDIGLFSYGYIVIGYITFKHFRALMDDWSLVHILFSTDTMWLLMNFLPSQQIWRCIHCRNGLFWREMDWYWDHAFLSLNWPYLTCVYDITSIDMKNKTLDCVSQ